MLSSQQNILSILYTVLILRIFRDILNSSSNWVEGDWTMCLLLTTESVVVVVRSPPKTGPYVVFTLDWDLRIIKVMFASFQGNTRTTNLNCSQYNEWIPAKRRKPIIWRWSIFCNLWEIVFVNVRESALFWAGALLQQCQKSYLQDMCAWLCYIKCVISVIPNHMHCPQLPLCVFSLSLPRSFYTLPSW